MTQVLDSNFRVRTERFESNSFWLICETLKNGFLWNSWSIYSKIIIEIKDFWDLGMHSEGQPLYKKPMMNRLIINYHSYNMETWKPGQFDLNERMKELYDEYIKDVQNKKTVEAIVNSYL